jgi:hypothetical protein
MAAYGLLFDNDGSRQDTHSLCLDAATAMSIRKHCTNHIDLNSASSQEDQSLEFAAISDCSPA